MNDTVLDAIKGDHNYFTFDVTGDIDAGDLIWFRAAPSAAELTDADATILKTRGDGVADVDTATGKFQVQLAPVDTSTLADDALMFHAKIRKVDVNMDTTVATGILRLR